MKCQDCGKRASYLVHGACEKCRQLSFELLWRLQYQK